MRGKIYKLWWSEKRHRVDGVGTMEKLTFDIEATNLWGHFMDGVLKACDQVCGKKRGKRSKGDTWL